MTSPLPELEVPAQISRCADKITGDSLPEGNPLMPALLDETRTLIDKLYDETQQTLTAKRAELDGLVAILIDRQEVTAWNSATC
jgi:hypothetical protein